jgi:hypothetical protein
MPRWCGRRGRRVEGHRVLDKASDIRHELPSVPRSIPSPVEQNVAQPTVMIEGQYEFGPLDGEVMSEQLVHQSERRLEIRIALVSTPT